MLDGLGRPGGAISRKRFLQYAGAGVVTITGLGALAACGGGDGEGDNAAADTGEGAAGDSALGGPLNVYTWEGYDLTDLNAAWRTENGIEQNNVGFLSVQDDAVTKLQSAAGKNIDISSANNSYAKYMYEAGLTSAITTEEVPGLADLFAYFADTPLFEISDGTYNAVPWTWGFVSITGREEVPPLDSYFDLLDPSLKGRVTTIDDAYNNVTMSAIINGINPDTMTKEQLHGPVKHWLVELKGQTKTLASSIGDQVNLLSSGEVDYTLIGLYLIDIFAKDNGVTTVTTLPKEGALGFVDAAVIPKEAPNRANALGFAERLVAGQSAADANALVFGATTAKSVVPLLPPDVKALYPYDDSDGFIVKLTFNAPYPREESGDLATFQDTIATWEEVKAS